MDPRDDADASSLVHLTVAQRALRVGSVAGRALDVRRRFMVTKENVPVSRTLTIVAAPAVVKQLIPLLLKNKNK